MDLPIDRRVPTELWHEICSYLYPSQLSRLSQVSWTLYEVVASLDVWRCYYDRIKLSYDSVSMLSDPLLSYPEAAAPGSEFKMLYVIAASYLVCDNCASVSHPRGPQKYAALPLAVPEWPSNEYRADLASSRSQSVIRLCLNCRRDYYDIYPEPIPSSVQDSYISKQEIRDTYSLGHKAVKSIKDRRLLPNAPIWGDEWNAARYGSWYSELEALEKARLTYGGDVGIRVYQENPHYLATKSREKMEAYCSLALSYVPAK